MSQALSTQTIFLICGLPGSGKTYFAKHLAEYLGAAHISSDRVRDEMDMMGQYNNRSKEVVYEEMRQQVIKAIEKYRVVIVDATFFSRQMRQPFFEVANAYDVFFHIIEVTASEHVIRQRVEREREDSEADYEVYLKLKNSFDPIQYPHLTLSSDDENVEQMIRQTLDYIGLTNDRRRNTKVT